MTLGDVSGNITVTAAKEAYGLSVYGKGYFGGGSKATISAGEISSDITVTGGTTAYGIKANAEQNSSSDSRLAEVSIEKISTAGFS